MEWRGNARSDAEQNEIRQASAVNRRRFLTAGGAAVAVAFGTNVASRNTANAVPGMVRANPFTLGIASGDPLPTAVVLWTRLAPEVFDPMGGMPYQNYSVQWQLATDARFRHIVRTGTATARPEYRRSVHVDARRLQSGRKYFYRFRAGPHRSPIGRTRTAPAAWARPANLRLGVVSCQAYSDGFYRPLHHLSREDLDVVFFLGDYIYQNAVNTAGGLRNDPSLNVPDIFQVAPDTLDLYRLRYSLYKTDPDLQEAHAAFPSIPALSASRPRRSAPPRDIPGADRVGEFDRQPSGRRHGQHRRPRRRPGPFGDDDQRLLVARRISGLRRGGRRHRFRSLGHHDGLERRHVRRLAGLVRAGLSGDSDDRPGRPRHIELDEIPGRENTASRIGTCRCSPAVSGRRSPRSAITPWVR
ncbi:MAG TPA: PhoD-like phosphatase N-terminal domain-containing protein [Mycobacteriales bacterium]|nr:PhoD-like phosphatase N-terminal domain-containing protein [Mycobacteriales bacterium]